MLARRCIEDRPQVAITGIASVVPVFCWRTVSTPSRICCGPILITSPRRCAVKSKRPSASRALVPIACEASKAAMSSSVHV